MQQLGGGLGRGSGLFNTPQTGLGGLSGGLGATSTGGGLFGAKPGGLFSGGTQSTGGLFGQTSTSQTGGLFSGGNAGGGGLFQTPQGGLNQQKTFGGGGLFGQSPSLGGTSTGLGGGLLGGGGGGGLFSQSQNTSTSGGLFRQQNTATSNTGGGLFGNKGLGLGTGLGTGLGSGLGGGLATGVVKFEPVTGTDTVNKNGITQTVNTKLHCISAMKQYEQSSLEEIRLSDYQAGRKGPTGVGLGTGLGLGGGLQSGGLAAGLGGTSVFGQQNKSLGLGGGLFSQSSQQSLGGLGTSTATSGGLFSGQGGGLFSNTNQNQLGGGLGNTGLFNQQTTQAGGLFSNQTSTAGGGLFNQQSQASGITGLGTTGLGGSSLFNRGAGTGLGTSLQSSQAGSLFNKPLGTNPSLGGGLSLGQPGQTGLGGGGLSLGGGLGGNISLGGGLGGGLGTGLGLGAQTSLGGGTGLGRGLGLGTGLGGGLGTLGTTQTTNLGQSSLQTVSLQQQQAHLNQQLENLANSPFGDSPLFRSALCDAAKRKSKESSTPVFSKATPTHPSHYKLNTRPSPRLKPKALSSPMRHHEKSKLFEGLDDSSASSGVVAGGGETFVPRGDIKKLKIKPKPSQPPLIPTPSSVEQQEQHRETTPTSHTAAFQPTPVSTVQQHDVTMGIPDSSLLATPLQKPVPVRPQTTPTSTSSPPSLPVSTAGDTPTPKRFSPPKRVLNSGSLARSPLRQRRCGLILPGDYYTIPPLDELDSMTTDSSCLVQNFTIGRKGYGEIHFPGHTDVFGMNLAEIVTISSKEVVVYPDDADKPSEGEGLNKKAVVSLEGNWPVDKSTREAIMDTERIEKMGYANKLQRMTEKIGATFLSYDSTTGVCQFEVNHFSKYKLDADDDSDDENGQDVGGVKKIKTQGVSKQTTTAMTVGAAQRTTRPRPVLQTRQPTTSLRAVHTDRDEDMSDEDGFEDAVGVVTSSRPHPLPVSQQLAAAMGVQSHRVQVMKASFFGQEEKPQHIRTPPLQRQGLLRGTHQKTTPLVQTTPLSHRTTDISHTPPSTSLQAQSAVLLAKHDLRTLVPYENSLVRNRERHIADLGLFLGRSFRVGWGPNWTLSHSGAQLSHSQTKSSSLFSGFGRPLSERSGEGHPVRALVERVAVPSSKEASSAYYRKFLEVQLAHTQFSDDTVQTTPTPGTELLHALMQHVKTTTSTESLAAGQLKRVLELAVALWGDLPGGCGSDPGSYEHCMARKRNVYKWLKNTNSEVTKNSHDPENYVKTLFSLVAGQQLSEACQLAREKGDYRLALLLGQATQNTIINRAYLHKQLEEWRRQKTDQRIDHERLKLYVLLSGEVVWDLSPNQRQERSIVNVCEGLDWKRVLALHLCYVGNPSSDISTAVNSYCHSFQSDSPYADPPRPPYLEDSDAPSDEPLPLDTCFHLLQLYCHRHYSLETTLDPSSSVPHPLDYGVSWLLWSVLTALGYTHMQPTREAQLHVSFSAQLEHEGAWQWAVFPLQHIPDSTLMENAIRELLTRNCSSSEEPSEQELFVIEQLHVAKEWVYTAKALRARYEKNYELEARHLLEAGQWNDAHTVIIKHLAADAIISDESRDLLEMLQVLSDPDRYGSVANWDIGGSVYLDFLRIGEQLLSIGQEVTQDSRQLIEDLILGLGALSHRIGQLECPTPKEILCQAEMAKKTASYMKLVLSLKYPEDSRRLYTELSQTLSQLPLPSDYALVEYRYLIQPCLSQLTNCY